jgi:MarR family 2-MHQ and catechol resistance regulon transcriptional repressor
VLRTAAEFKEAFPWTDEASVQAILAVHAAATALSNAGREVTQALGLGGMVSRFSVLRALDFAPEHRLSQKEIAGRLLVGWASVTDLVSSLERDGLVRRTRNEADRRSFIVSLTPAGEAVSARYIPAIARLAEKFCAGLTDEQKHQLTELLLAFCRSAPEDPLELLEAD